MGGGSRAYQLFVHVGVPRELLHIAIAADADEPLPPSVIGVPEALHDAEDPEHPAVRTHEAFARRAQRLGVAGNNELIGRIGGQAAAGHGVEDPFARRGRNHARRIASEEDVASVVPARQRA